MKRINIAYDGREYSMGNRSLEDVQKEIAAGIASPTAAWLTVNLGEGQPRETQLLLGIGTHIALTPISEEEEDARAGLDRDD